MRRLVSLAASCACLAGALRTAKEGAPAALLTDDAQGNYWPTSRGMVLQQGTSSLVGPKLDDFFNVSSMGLWTFQHPEGRYHSIILGIVVDDEKHTIVTMDSDIFRVSPNGTALWHWEPPHRDNWITTVAALADGRVHFATSNGKFWALDIKSGNVLWEAKVCHTINTTDRGVMGVHEGKIVAAFNSSDFYDHETNGLVVGLDSTNGAIKWATMPSVPTSNFQPVFPGDGTVLFQDAEGTAYMHDLHTGKLIWQAPGVDDSWTTGAPVLANGIFYTVASNGKLQRHDDEDGPDDLTPGWLFARNAKDGTLLWRKRLPMPADSSPTVGHLAGREGLSVVVPCGYNVMNGTTAVIAYDAATGDKQWTFEGPVLEEYLQAGIHMGFFNRIIGHASEAAPRTQPWSAPLIDAAGTVYVGGQDGNLYVLRDEDLDGKIDGPGEKRMLPTGSTALGTSSPAMVPGMFLFAQTDTLIALRLPEQPLSA